MRSSRGSTQNAVLAAPPQASSPRERRTLLATGSSTDGEAEPEADAGERGLGEQRPPEGLQVGAAREVVGGHVVDGARAEQADAVELAAPAQQLAKRW